MEEEIKNGKYDNKFPNNEDSIAATEYNGEDGRIYYEFKKDIFEQFKVTGSIAEKMFAIAYSTGYVNGYLEVFILFEMLVQEGYTLEELDAKF